MLSCWYENPAERPTFSTLHQKLRALIQEGDSPGGDDKQEDRSQGHYHSIYVTPDQHNYNTVEGVYVASPV
jgi:hypothetical protein